MLMEYTRNSNYRRLAILLTTISNIEEIIGRIDFETIFFEKFIRKISMNHLIRKLLENLSR